MRVGSFLCSLFLLLGGLSIANAAPPDVGIVLMHGKWGSPRGLQALGRELERRGYRVRNPEMPWSESRMYDADYPAALRQIAEEVRRLHADGASKIVVAGQSIGANAALAYAASGLDLDVLALLAPGHDIEGGMGRRLHPSIEKARQMAGSGRGAEYEEFEDSNQGRLRTIRTSAATYLSYFDPGGRGAMQRNARGMPRPLPVFLAIGTRDPYYEASKNLFDAMPRHPASRYAAFDTGHGNLAEAVTGDFVEWLNGLAF